MPSCVMRKCKNYYPNIKKDKGVSYHTYVGYMDSTQSIIIIRDPEIIKNITGRDFDHFTDHKAFAPENEPLFGSSVFGMTGILKSETEEEADNVGFATVEETLKPPTQRNRKNFSLNDIISQVFIFFSAGFETSAGALILCIHELALHPGIEKKLYQEIKAFKEKRGNLDFDNISELAYLDAVLNETMRKWSGAIFLDRVCTRTYELPPLRPGAKPYTVKPGDIVYNMVNAIHLDPKYHPDPHKFDPERFSNENKHKIKPFTFQPFGLGPRICIGSRFAILEIKILLYHVILNFRILRSAKTMDPIKLEPGDFNIKVKGGSFVRMEKRN